MNIRPLVIGAAQIEDIARVIAYAERERFTASEMKMRVERKDTVPIGDDMGHTCVLPVGYKVTFSIEEQPAPLGWCNHISVSVMENKKMPNEAAVMAICQSFGFTPTPGNYVLYIEDVSEGEKAVNILVPRKEE